MPAPRLLAFLPKPVLFGLYGAIGGLLGALVFGEPAWQVLKPPPPPPAHPEPQVAVSASKEVQLLLNKENTFSVEIDRAEFDGPVDVSVENLPAGVSASAAQIPKGQTSGTVRVRSSGGKSGTTTITVGASASANGKPIAATAPVSLQMIDPASPAADVYFVLDVTGSMGWAIDGIRDGIGGFAQKMRENRIDFRIGLLAFRDLTYDREPMDQLMFDGQPFTTDATAFRNKVGDLVSMGGGDEPESSLEAVEKACRLKYRPEATKVLLLITDAPPKVKPQQNMRQTFEEELAGAQKAAIVVKDARIDLVNLVVRPQHLDIFKPLMDAGASKGSRFFDLQNTVARGHAGFTSLLDSFTSAVVEAAAAKNPTKPVAAAGAEKPVLTTRSLQSSAQYAEGFEGRLLLLSAVWAGAIAALVCAALLAGQHHYLRGVMPTGAAFGVGIGGGVFAGLVGGACGYGLYLLSPGGVILDGLFRLLGWTLLGGLAGCGLSLFIPNLKWVHGLGGGALGGAAGAIGFILVSGLASKVIGGSFGDVIGRLSGGMIVGLCIGLMVAIVEAAFRRAWLEVRYGARETITVNLGPEPVKIGGDNRLCTVWARGAAPVALRYFIRGGEVVCEDALRRSESVVENGDSREVGNVTVTVRTGTSAAPSPDAARRPTAAPPLPRVPAAAPAAPAPAASRPLSLDPFEDDDPLPMPVAAPAAPRPAPQPPVPTAGARPAAPPSAAPRSAPPTPAAKPAAARDPNGCPSCGRINPGRPGSRFCMLCDQTY
jgi:hypothetical protein